MSDPFRPPSSRVADGAPPPGSAAKAVLVGLAVDVGGSMAAGLGLSILYGASLAAGGASPEQIQGALQDVPLDSWVSLLGMAVGTLFSALGGYVCARIARHSEFALGAVLALLSIASGLLLGADQYSLGLNLVLALVCFLAVMVGVRFGAERNESERAAVPPPAGP